MERKKGSKGREEIGCQSISEMRELEGAMEQVSQKSDLLLRKKWKYTPQGPTAPKQRYPSRAREFIQRYGRFVESQMGYAFQDAEAFSAFVLGLNCWGKQK